MVVPRARALGVAVGVPTAFAVLAAVLGIAARHPSALAEEPVAAAAVVVPFAVTRPDPRTAYRPIPVTYRVGTTDPVAFITIDDGVHKPDDALAFVEAHALPVTAFITSWTVKDDADYFRRLTAWGSIQNHSASHASLAADDTDLFHEICYAQRALHRDFGMTPWMMRPPYGEGAERFGANVLAHRCGVSEFVMWDASVSHGRVRLATGRLDPGSIVLLHFGPDLARDLRAATDAIDEAGLAPADLADYLTPDRRD